MQTSKMENHVMRRFVSSIAFMVAAWVVAPAALSAFTGPLNDADRARILSELQASRKLFLDAIAGVSAAQWSFKAGPARWSIAEIAEHIVKAEGFIGGGVRESLLKFPTDTTKAARLRPDYAKLDDDALNAIRDRTRKAEAPAPIVPTGIYRTPLEAADAFKAARQRTLEYIRTTHDDLRDHFSAQITGSELDGVQGLLTLSGHTERHVAQIEEVKHSPGYPKM